MSSAPTTGCTASRAPCGASIPGARPTRSSRSKTSAGSSSKTDLARAEAFAAAFGFTTALRTQDELHLRGTDPGAPCVLIRRGPRSRFVGPAFVAAEQSDLLRLADATGGTVRPLPETLGGVAVELVDPSGLALRVVSGTHQLEALPAQQPHVFNFGHEVVRANTTQRPPRVPTRVQRLGHVVVQTPKYLEALNWYLDHLGMIVSDFCFYPGQRERGPIMSFIRCDRGSVPADHHTLAMALGPVGRYVHSAYQVGDLDALAAGGEHLREQGYYRSWGIGRHIQGSQIFDYWRDPDGFWSSTSPTATCSTTPWSRAGRRWLPPGWRSGDPRPARTSWASEHRAKPRPNLP